MSKPEKITINIKTITPIWTGGIHRNKMEYIKGSSIMGGLRFWAESYFIFGAQNQYDYGIVEPEGDIDLMTSQGYLFCKLLEFPGKGKWVALSDFFFFIGEATYSRYSILKENG